MHSPPSSSDRSKSFTLLAEPIQRWIYQEQWSELHDVQERAIPALLNADRDVVIAAATAAGKTEAAFLPILSNLLADSVLSGLVLYVSPLKALINDQWSRLNDLCGLLDIPVLGWHGDVSASRKQKFFKHPVGVLLITPESLEAMLVGRGASLRGVLALLRYLVVDELHAFIGSERGKQLQSLLHRVEVLAGRRIPRVGLSATLGDIVLASAFLRPRVSASILPMSVIESKASNRALQVLVKGVLHRPPRIDVEPDIEHTMFEDTVPGSTIDIANHLYASLRGSNNLIFPNSRRQVETYADLLRRMCERDGVANEFWPHHGSLSKELREDSERALKEGTRPASAICTTTLELGIDIGAVKSVAQIGPPPSVASLTQRLGRSGRRRGEDAILRAYCVEHEIEGDADLSVRIREGLVQTIAMIELLAKAHWVEPPRIEGLHASTLVQQILSIIAERGGCSAAQLWQVLVQDGPFERIGKNDFAAMLRQLGKLDLIVQTVDGTLLHGVQGQRHVNHYAFYASFAAEEECRLVAGTTHLGSLPLSQVLSKGQTIIFGGRRWRVEDVDLDKKVVYVRADAGGAAPQFDGKGAMVHDRVRQQMRDVLSGTEAIAFLDRKGHGLLDEARRYYHGAGLAEATLFAEGASVLIATWRGDWINDALALLLRTQRLDASNEGVVVRVSGSSVYRVHAALAHIGSLDNAAAESALESIDNIDREKWDWALPPEVKRRAFASSWLDLPGAIALAKQWSIDCL